MSFSIQLLPSGNRFEAEPGETLLEAGLRSGINFTYSCNSGTCGECKARVVEGRLGEMMFHDYHLSAAERARNITLLCRATAASDLVIEAREISDTSQVPVQQVQTRVYRMERIGDRYMVLYLRTPRTRTLQFLAGQAVTLTLPGGLSGSLALAGCPCNGMVLQFHLRRDPGNPFSDAVFTGLTNGETVMVEGPSGDFVLDEDSTRPIVMVGWDTGFASVKSLVEHAIALEMNQAIRFHWAARHSDGHYLLNYCRAWESALDDFRVVPILVETEADAGDALVQSLLAEPYCPGSDLYLSVPPRLGVRIGERLKAEQHLPATIRLR